MNEHRSLLRTVTDKAEKSFTKSVTLENFEEWRQHWIQTAMAWRDELAMEGLPLTVEKLDKIINFEVELNKYWENRRATKSR